MALSASVTSVHTLFVTNYPEDVVCNGTPRQAGGAQCNIMFLRMRAGY